MNPIEKRDAMSVIDQSDRPNLNQTPMGSRITISLFGKRNAGKSTLMNRLTNQSISVVSDVAGTTTDPVYKAMELLPLGPVTFVDTAGFDDVGELGGLRTKKTKEVVRKTDVALVVLQAGEALSEEEKEFIEDILHREVPIIVFVNKCDVEKPKEEMLHWLQVNHINHLLGSAREEKGILLLKERIVEAAKVEEEELSLVSGIIQPGDMAVLVTPIDKAAPKGRLILPQQQTIRDILEKDAMCVVTKEHELKATLESLTKKPAIVITDSQAFLKVSADTPKEIPLTSFSILFARYKGELTPLIEGIRGVKNLRPNARVLIVEGCSHHRQSDDIGTVKIPRWLRQMVGGELVFSYASGSEFPEDVTEYDLIVHCGACMLNNKEMKYRLNMAREQGVPITNYGMVIAYVQGVLQRALRPFPYAYDLLEMDDSDME